MKLINLKPLTSAGKYLFAIPFIVFGFFHLTGANEMAADMLPGWPIGVYLIYLTGLALILAGGSIIINKMTSLAMFLLALLLFSFIITIHIPGLIGAADDQAMQISMTAFLKDFALMGAALSYAGLFKS